MSPERLTQFDFHHVVAESTGLSLVYFTAPGCGACRQWRRFFEEQGDDLEGIRLFEVDAQQEMALTREFEVFHLPSLFLFRDGQYHAPIQAEPRPQSLIDAIEAALAAAPQEAP